MCFSEISNTAKLYVYEDVVKDYKSSEWAQYFSEILSIETKVESPEIDADGTEYFKVFNPNGANVLNTANKSDLNNLPEGLYIINGKKVMIGK